MQNVSNVTLTITLDDRNELNAVLTGDHADGETICIFGASVAVGDVDPKTMKLNGYEFEKAELVRAVWLAVMKFNVIIVNACIDGEMIRWPVIDAGDVEQMIEKATS